MNITEEEAKIIKEREDQKWLRLRLNKKFLRTLYTQVDSIITNKEAYEVYNLERSNDTWYQMNIRNQLSALAHHLIIERIAPGVYDLAGHPDAWTSWVPHFDNVWAYIDEINKRFDEETKRRAS